jgi:hypothetical protein
MPAQVEIITCLPTPASLYKFGIIKSNPWDAV